MYWVDAILSRQLSEVSFNRVYMRSWKPVKVMEFDNDPHKSWKSLEKL